VLVVNSAVAGDDFAGKLDGLLDRLANFKHDGKPRIAPIFTKPGGQTYGRWAAQWHQWALGVPVATNPVLDKTGEFCAVRQVGDTWFLAGKFGPPVDPDPGPVTRECTLPEGKALFFPLVNRAQLFFITDIVSDEEARESVSCDPPNLLFAEIDGFEIRRLEKFSTGEEGSQSPLFNVQLPPDDILTAGFGLPPDFIPELALSPSAEEGFYLYVKPLAPGEHVIHWFASGCGAEDSPQDITYLLTIVGDDDEDED
jgi:hypothetical protein